MGLLVVNVILCQRQVRYPHGKGLVPSAPRHARDFTEELKGEKKQLAILHKRDRTKPTPAIIPLTDEPIA